MRSVLRTVLVVAVVSLVWNASRPAAQGASERLITLRVQTSSPSLSRTMTVSEGDAVLARWTEGNIAYRFALRPVLDDEDGLVRVAVESIATGRVLGEFALTVGAPSKPTGITPTFSIQVVRVRDAEPARFGRR